MKRSLSYQVLRFETETFHPGLVRVAGSAGHTVRVATQEDQDGGCGQHDDGDHGHPEGYNGEQSGQNQTCSDTRRTRSRIGVRQALGELAHLVLHVNIKRNVDSERDQGDERGEGCDSRGGQSVSNVSRDGE